MNEFPKGKRLLNKQSFDRVYKHHRKVVMPEFLLIVAPNEQGTARLGLAFSKKHLKNATMRNRIKRIFRESFRLQQLVALDIIACGRSKNLAQVDKQKIRADLEIAWKKLSNLYANC